MNKMGERPFVIAMRSYTGSRVALIDAACDLLTASGAITYGQGGSHFEWYLDQERKRSFVARAVLFKSELPVEQIVGLMTGIEERLGGSLHPDAPTLKLDLLWVERVEMDTPELVLPSPLIENTHWVTGLFVEAAEHALINSAKEGREKMSTAYWMAEAYDRFRRQKAQRLNTEGGWGPPEVRRNSRGTSYKQCADEEVDGVATAGDLLLYAEADARGIKSPAQLKNESDEDAGYRVQDALEKLGRDTVLPLEVSTGADAPINGRAQAWVDGLAALLREQGFVGRTTVIFSMEPTRIRGAVLGQAQGGSLPSFGPGDAVVATVRWADLPENANRMEPGLRDPRYVTLSTRGNPRQAASGK